MSLVGLSSVFMVYTVEVRCTCGISTRAVYRLMNQTHTYSTGRCSITFLLVMTKAIALVTPFDVKPVVDSDGDSSDVYPVPVAMQRVPDCRAYPGHYMEVIISIIRWLDEQNLEIFAFIY